MASDKVTLETYYVLLPRPIRLYLYMLLKNVHGFDLRVPVWSNDPVNGRTCSYDYRDSEEQNRFLHLRMNLNNWKLKKSTPHHLSLIMVLPDPPGPP